MFCSQEYSSKFIAVSTIFLWSFSSPIFAEDSLATAKQEWAAELREAQQQLVSVFDEAIIIAAKSKDTESIKALIEQKEAFLQQQRRPTLKVIESGFEKYLSKRQELSAKLQAKYQASIAASAAKLQLPLSTSLQKEANEIADEEKRILAKLTAKTVELLPVKQSKTRDQLEEFQSLYQEQLDLISQTKDEQKLKVLNSELSEKLNKYLKNRNWSFHCEVKEIKNVSTINDPDQYKITIAPPEELIGWRSKWKFTTTETVRLKRSDADKVKQGQIMVISGYPRFIKVTSQSYFMYTQAPDSYFHYLSFEDFKFNIRKPLPDEIPKAE
jgi:plasmid maintenance system killer protein